MAETNRTKTFTTEEAVARDLVHEAGRRHVLQVDLGESAVPCLPQSEGPNPLRHRALDPRASGIVSGELLGRLTTSRPLDRLVFVPHLERQRARNGLGTGAASTDRAGRAVVR